MIKKLVNKYRNVPITIKASFAYALCSILIRCLSFITLPLFTRLLTTEQYGEFTVYQSWESIISIFTTLNLAYGSFSTAMVKYENKRDSYISSIQGIMLTLSAIFIVIYLLFYKLWNKLFQLSTGLIVLMIFEIICNNAIILWSGKKRFEYKYKSVVAITMIIAFLSTIFAFILVTHSDNKGTARILGYALVTIIFGTVIFAYNTYRGKQLYNKEFWQYAFKFNIPLITYYLSQMIFNQSDRIMISHLTGKSDAAMYGVAYNFAMILNFILNAINNSYVPWLYEKIKSGTQIENRRVSLLIAAFMGTLLLGIIWFAPEIIIIMAGKNYKPAINVVAPVAMSLLLLFYAQLFINIEFYFEQKKNLVIASIGAAIINIILNWIFIPILGFWAAGYTTWISYVIFALCNYFAMKNTLKKENIKESGYNIKGLITLFIAFTIIGFIGVALYKFLIIRIIILIIVLIVLFVFRKKLKEIFELLKFKE